MTCPAHTASSVHPSAASTQRPVTGVDSHAHVFSRNLPLTEGRRYSPDYDALIDDFLGHLDRHGLSHGVLVQPSFLGTDNSYMLAAMAQQRTRLRGVVVIDRDMAEAELDRLSAAGVVGARLNLIGKDVEDYDAPRWQQFFQRLAQRHWHIEIHRHIDDIHQFLPAILASGVQVVIDHFGRPQAGIQRDNPQHQAFLDLLASQQIWIKLSASYRNHADVAQAITMLDLLRDACGGSQRFLWGSDWPHTQFEDQTGYDHQFSIMEQVITDGEERKKVLVDNPTALFKLA